MSSVHSPTVLRNRPRHKQVMMLTELKAPVCAPLLVPNAAKGAAAYMQLTAKISRCMLPDDSYS